MNIIGINCSPRKGSNSRLALLKALESAENKGASTCVFDINELNKNSFELELKIELSRQTAQDEMEEVFTLLNRSAKHFSSKVVKCWSFVVVFHESEQLNFAFFSFVCF